MAMAIVLQISTRSASQVLVPRLHGSSQSRVIKRVQYLLGGGHNGTHPGVHVFVLAPVRFGNPEDGI